MSQQYAKDDDPDKFLIQYATPPARTIFLFEASPLFGSGISDSDWDSADLGLQHTANSSKRSKKNPVVSNGEGTPPAEDSWWTDRKIDWEKDCGGESHQSSFAYFKDWIPTGIRYMPGAIGGYNLKKGAKEFQRYLYLKKGPTRRSVKSIENKELSDDLGRRRRRTSINGDDDSDDQQDENPSDEEDRRNLSSQHPLLEKSIRKRPHHARPPRGAPGLQPSEEDSKMLGEDLELSRQRERREAEREKREIEQVETERARRAAEADHWRRHADYFEGQNNLAQIQMAYYRQKMRNEEVESAARISSQMSISLQEAFSVLRRARGISEDS
ncbi:hypothetical protein D1P53_000029 [Cryptococcus gattii VGV]|nr:hypothetical protein D1P53_000029 [Cryptococcus gattii VGV]